MPCKLYRFAAVCAAVLSSACPGDPPAPSGSLRVLQIAGRVGEEQDGLGALVVGQAVCGTDVCVYAEGGTVAYRGEAPQAKLCLPLPGRGAVRSFELSAFPAHSAMTLHSELRLAPASCAAADELCKETCKGLEDAKKDDPPVILDQSTLVVHAVLAEPEAGASSTEPSSTATGSGTDGGASTSASSGVTDTTTSDGSTT